MTAVVKVESKEMVKNSEQRDRMARNAAAMRQSRMVENSFLMRRQVLDHMLDPRRDINKECGYPTDLTPEMYHLLYQRVGMAKRVVSVIPDETWKDDPKVYEKEDEETKTKFEDAWDSMLTRLNLWYHLHRIDVVSGIGRFGVLLLGFSDGLDYSQPVPGWVDLVDSMPSLTMPALSMGMPNPPAESDAVSSQPVIDTTPMAGRNPKPLKLLFVRSFDESVVRVNSREMNIQNPRYGQPVMYTLTFRDVDLLEGQPAGALATVGDVTRRVHHSRVIHVADDRQMSEVYGTPRMQPLLDRLIDYRKTMGGSAEMFWKGGFPGISFEINPNLGDADIDREQMREDIEDYANGLSRYLSMVGVTAKSLTPQIADPTPHIEAQREDMAITLGIPKRILFGSEEAKLASSQDARTWNGRLARRQDKYVGPMLIKPFIDRLIGLNVLPAPSTDSQGEWEYKIHWPDLNTATDAEKANIALLRTQALAAYIAGGVDQLVPPQEYLSMVCEMEPAQVDQIMEAAEAQETTIAQQAQDDNLEHMQKVAAAFPEPSKEGDPAQVPSPQQETSEPGGNVGGKPGKSKKEKGK